MRNIFTYRNQFLLVSLKLENGKKFTFPIPLFVLEDLILSFYHLGNTLMKLSPRLSARFQFNSVNLKEILPILSSLWEELRTSGHFTLLEIHDDVDIRISLY